MEIKYQDNKMKVFTEYSSVFVKGAKRLNGKWDGQAWVFDIRDKERVNELLFEVYGENEEKKDELVDVEIDLSSLGQNSESTIELFGRVVAKRYSRDSNVKMHSSVSILTGDFPKRGGSSNYPALKAEDNTVLLVRDVPFSLFEKEKQKYPVGAIALTQNSLDSLIEQNETSIESLIKRQEKLLKELDEIEELLSKMQG